jgi:hypothetical protein
MGFQKASHTPIWVMNCQRIQSIERGKPALKNTEQEFCGSSLYQIFSFVALLTTGNGGCGRRYN